MPVFHTRTVLSQLPAATSPPSGLKATPVAMSAKPPSSSSCLPLAASHSRTFRSQPVDAILRPSGLNAAALVHSAWPASSLLCAPVAVSQRRTSASRPVEAILRPSGLNARPPPRLPVLITMRAAPVAASHSRIVPS